MSLPLAETHFFAAAAVCLVGAAAIALLDARWRTVERSTKLLALLCMVAGLGLSAIKRGGWPLLVTAEVILASAAGAMLWRVLCRHGHKSKLGALLLYAIAAGLLVWGVARWPTPQAVSVVNSVQQAWLFASHLTLALACGAFVEAGSLALACLLTARQTNSQADMDCNEKAGRNAVLAGLPLLTVSLLLTALGGQYTHGVYWSWTVSESWHLLTWLFHAILWCTLVLLGWRGRRLWGLATVGLILTLLMLKAMGG